MPSAEIAKLEDRLSNLELRSTDDSSIATTINACIEGLGTGGIDPEDALGMGKDTPSTAVSVIVECKIS